MRYEMIAFIFAVTVTGSAGLRLQSHSSTQGKLSSGRFNDSRVPFPTGLNYTQLYCYSETTTSSFADLTTTSFVEAKRQTFISCNKTADCQAADLTTPYCFQGLCRECLSASNCTARSSKTTAPLLCNLDTSFTCSECGKDSDCPSNQICRKVFSPSVNRQQCVSCTASQVPIGSVVSDTGSCSWFCQGYESIGSDGKCRPCPKCSDGEMLIPSSDFALATPTSFFPSCAYSSNPKCVACPGQDNPCALQMSPSSDYSNAPYVGKLPPQFPCQFFTCKTGWWLDKTIDKCKRCDLRSCPSGSFLQDCGGINPGTCTACPSQANPSISFIDPRDPTYTVNIPTDVCVPSCASGFFLNKPNAIPSSPWICSPCSSQPPCPAGYLFSGCGGPNPGSCLLCAAAPMPGTYWSASGGCAISACAPESCKPGSFLTNCGGTSAGSCQTCPNLLPANASRYVSIYDQVTQTTDTCAVECLDNFYVVRSLTSQSKFECKQCDSSICALGEQLVECGKDQPGRCVACPPPAAGRYALPVPGSPCNTAACPKDSSICAPGTYLSGCGGTSNGSCIDCGPLPIGALSWKQVLPGSTQRCDVICGANFTAQAQLVGGSSSSFVTQCISCNTTASQCPPGTQLVGCNNNSSGFCQSCPPLLAGQYWNSSLGCASSSCSSYKCGPGQYAVGCAGNYPGTCVPCGSSLPPGASGWKVIENVCYPVCKAGFYYVSGACSACNIGDCAVGQVLTNCGESSPGICQTCSPLPSGGSCFTSYGKSINKLDSCDIGPCTSAAR